MRTFICIWLVGGLTVAIIWISIGVRGAVLPARFQATKRDRIESAMTMFLLSLPIFAVIWPLTALYLVYAVCITLKRRLHR